MAVLTKSPAERRRGSSHRPMWMERPSPVMRAVKVVVLVIVTLSMLYPFLYVVAVSLTGPRGQGVVFLWPQDFSLQAYRAIFSTDIVFRATLVSVGVTLVGTFLAVSLTVALAYGLSRTKEVPGSRFVLYLCLLTMLFGAGIIPNYLLIKTLGLLDSYAALILPGMISAFNLVVLRNFFMGIPRELTDAARIDGASDFRVLWSVVLPLSKAIIAVIALFYAVAYWSNFFDALLYIGDTTKWPIQLVLNQYVVQGSALEQVQRPGFAPPPAQSIKMAVLVVATIPILLVYPFVQRNFTRGVLTGAIKQ